MVSELLPRPLVEFVRLFNGGEFWESHEVLERPWRETRSAFYQGMILLASAWVHVERENPRGIVAQLRKAEQRLEPYGSTYLGVDVAALLEHAGRVREAVESRSTAAPPRSWSEIAPAPRIDLSTGAVGGQEPELRLG